MPRDITRQYKNIRITGNTKKRMFNRKRTPNKKKIFSKKTFINSYSKFKTKIIKN